MRNKSLKSVFLNEIYGDSYHDNEVSISSKGREMTLRVLPFDNPNIMLVGVNGLVRGGDNQDVYLLLDADGMKSLKAFVAGLPVLKKEKQEKAKPAED